MRLIIDALENGGAKRIRDEHNVSMATCCKIIYPEQDRYSQNLTLSSGKF